MKSLKSLLPRLTAVGQVAATLSRLQARQARAAPVDARQLTDTIERALSAAGIDPRSGTSAHARDTIQAAIRQAGADRASDDRDRSHAGTPTLRTASDALGANPSAHSPRADDRVNPGVDPAPPVARGTSTERSFGNAAGTRAYTLYVPAGHDPLIHRALPLVVMLHGCTQSPSDFAAGTRMNALADRHGVLVAWPEQPARDNGQRCWNWFRTEDQARGAGEPSILAGIVGHIAADHRIDPRRVYVAGLSAGAGMAVILGHAYPDVFAAVGAHSGLPVGAAHDVISAFAAMQGSAGLVNAGSAARRDARVAAAAVTPMPTIVFHGNGDHTVHQRNGAAIVNDAVAAFATTAAPLTSTRSETPLGDGRACTRHLFSDDAGRARVEHWVVHGAGHAWSGGDAAGSYTDPTGPDASEHMLRFFLQQPH